MASVHPGRETWGRSGLGDIAHILADQKHKNGRKQRQVCPLVHTTCDLWPVKHHAPQCSLTLQAAALAGEPMFNHHTETITPIGSLSPRYSPGKPQEEQVCVPTPPMQPLAPVNRDKQKVGDPSKASLSQCENILWQTTKQQVTKNQRSHYAGARLLMEKKHSQTSQ